MESHSFIDIFATKGIEYLIVIGFMLVFAGFASWFFSARRRRPARAAGQETVEWFRVPARLQYHQGHAWVGTGEDGTVSVGIDDFAQKLVGKVEAVELPAVGASVTQGEKGWTLTVGSRPVPMLCPIDGEVVAVNADVVTKPASINDDPFGAGWLFRVKPTRARANATSLMSGALALDWTNRTLDKLRLSVSEDVGMVLQDGGEPIPGLARAVSGEKWQDTVQEYFHTSDKA